MAGAGGVGAAIGGRLFEAGNEVVLIARGPHLTALQAGGLQLDEPDRSRALAIPAVGSPAEIAWQPDDVVVLATKSQDTETVLAAVHAAAPEVTVICAQNGVANERAAARSFARVLSVCVMLPAEHLEPGRVVVHAAPTPGILDIGQYPTGADELCAAISADLRAAGFDSRPDPAISRWKYRKLLSNLGNAVDAGISADDPDRAAVEQAITREGEACLAAAGIDVATPDEDAARRVGLRFAPVNGERRQGGSSWQSLRRGTGSIETAYLNGEIVELGARFGVPVPVNAALTTAVLDLAARHAAPGSLCAADLLADR